MSELGRLDTKKGGKTMKNRKRNTNSIVKILVLITLCAIVFTSCSSSKENETQKLSDIRNEFITYEDATLLVEVLYYDGILTSRHVVGFVNESQVKAFEEGKLSGLKVYHPYIEGNYVIVNSNTIRLITTFSYEDFYRKYSPKYVEKDIFM